MSVFEQMLIANFFLIGNYFQFDQSFQFVNSFQLVVLIVRVCKLDILVKLKLDILSNWNIYLVCHLTSLLFYTRYSSQTFIPVFCLRFNQMTFTEKIYVI